MARLMDKQDFYAYEFEGSKHDCGSKIGYLEAVIAHALEHDEIGDEARELIKSFV